MFNSFFIAGMILTPSLYFLIVAYSPVFILAETFLIVKEVDLDNAAAIESIAMLPLYYLTTVAIFYVFQYRELLRFFEIQDSRQKSKQLLTILNAHKNAIIVVEAN